MEPILALLVEGGSSEAMASAAGISGVLIALLSQKAVTRRVALRCGYPPPAPALATLHSSKARISRFILSR